MVLQVQVFYQHHNRGVDVLWVLNQPLTVDVVAVVGHQVARRSEVATIRVIQDTATF